MVHYYGVKVGKKVGIYLTWKECEENVKNFPNAKFKKFNTKKEAENFINDKKPIKKNNKLKITTNLQIVQDDYNFENCINVYTDGSCINNGKKYAMAGCGIYFDTNDKRNKSLELKKKNNYNITNNRAELKAILYAIKILMKEIIQDKIIIIHTDSKYSIISFTSNNLEEKNPIDVPNYDYVKKGNAICKKYPNIKFHHIKAHTNKQDIHSIGNDNADKLANQAVNKDVSNIVLNFGKYKNKTIEEIYKINKDYLLWCTANININKNDILLFLETKKNTLDKSSDKINNNQSENNKKNKIKIKIYKINGTKCVKVNNSYYTFSHGKKGELFAITNENDKVELVE